MLPPGLRLGFLGVGAIGEALLRGLLADDRETGWSSRIWLSRRGHQRVEQLVAEFPQLRIGTNAEVVQHSDWVFLAVLPSQAEKVVRELGWGREQKLVSLVAGHSCQTLRQWAGADLDVARLIPLPPVEHRRGPLPVYPPHAPLVEFLQPLGTPIELSHEAQFSALSAASSSMATFFEFAAAIAGWIERQGVPAEAAARYATSMLQALAGEAASWTPAQLADGADRSLTPGGLNEQVLRELRATDWFEALTQQLDQIAARLQAAHPDG